MNSSGDNPKDKIAEAFRCFEGAAKYMVSDDNNAALNQYRKMMSILKDLLHSPVTDNEKRSIENWIKVCSLQKKDLDKQVASKDKVKNDKEETSEGEKVEQNTQSKTCEKSQDIWEQMKKTEEIKSTIELSKIKFNEDNRVGNKGKCGDVYKGEYEGKEVAIKMHNYRDTKNEDDARIYVDIVEEMDFVSKFDHPNLVKTFGWTRKVDKSTGMISVVQVMELADTDLKNFVVDKTSEPYLKKLFMDALNGLKCLHEQKCIHSDIKPENILVLKSSDGGYLAKLCDFDGICKERVITSQLIGRTIRAYTPNYLAPEVGSMFEEKAVVLKESDMYSMGLVAYYMCTKKEAGYIGYNSMKSLEDVDKMLDDAGITDKFWRVAISSCLNHEPSNRLSAKHLLLVLRELL